MSDSAIQAVLASLSEKAMLFDPKDLPPLAESHDQFREISRLTGEQRICTAIEAATKILERVMMRDIEGGDAASALDTVTQTVINIR